MKKANRGFTLIELLVALIIIGIIAGISLLSMSAIDNKARAVACLNNRATIIRALGTYRLLEGKTKNDLSLQDFIDADYKGTISNNYAKCPSKGIYTASADVTGREFVVCNVHSPSPGGEIPPGGSGNYMPGTASFGNPGIPPNSTWPTPTYDNSGTVVTNKVVFPKGSSFSYVKNGVTEYYVVINNSGIQFGRNKDAVTLDYAWGSGEITKVSTKDAVTWANVVANNLSVSKGEIVYDEVSGKYYISRQDGLNKWTPIGTGNWVEIN